VGSVSVAVPAGSRVLLDAVTLVYFLEEHPGFGAVAERLLGCVESGELEGVLSSLAFAELLVPLYRAGNEAAAAALVDRLRGFRNLGVVGVDAAIASRAAQLRATYGLRTPDAIHAATALHSGAAGIVSNDAGLRRLAGEIRIWLFDELT
jgi:uncharacterized protein